MDADMGGQGCGGRAAKTLTLSCLVDEKGAQAQISGLRKSIAGMIGAVEFEETNRRIPVENPVEIHIRLCSVKSLLHSAGEPDLIAPDFELRDAGQIFGSERHQRQIGMHSERLTGGVVQRR